MPYETDLEIRVRHDSEIAAENSHHRTVMAFYEGDDAAVVLPEPLVWVSVIDTIGLLNGWAAPPGFFNQYGPVEYAVDNDKKLVYMRGSLDGTSATSEVAFILPLEARPSKNSLTPIFNATNCKLFTNGEVQIITGTPYICLDGIVFSL